MSIVIKTYKLSHGFWLPLCLAVDKGEVVDAEAQLRLFTRMKKSHVVAAYVISLLIASIAAQSSREREWKSLGNPFNRDLFFKFLKSYITGRGTHMMNPGNMDKPASDSGANGENKFSHLQQYMDNNEIVDI